MSDEHDATPDEAPPKRRRFRLASRRSLVRLAVIFALLIVFVLIAYARQLNMPGSPMTGPLPPLSPEQGAALERLRDDLTTLCDAYPHRSVFDPRTYDAAGEYIHSLLAATGLDVQVEPVPGPIAESRNYYVEIPGAAHPGQTIIVGAHYDTEETTPGADDNASGVVGVIELARRLAGAKPDRTIRLVIFANEEALSFGTDAMGSQLHANNAHARGDDIRAMISLEMIGYYDESPGSQQYPPPLNLLYPDTADFIAVVGNLSSTALTRRAARVMRDANTIPVYGAALPAAVPGIAWSDHHSFWRLGVPAIMITDTSFYRNPNYHQPSDTPDTLDFARMARVLDAVEALVRDLASAQ